jgi:hypothetical protein
MLSPSISRATAPPTPAWSATGWATASAPAPSGCAAGLSDLQNQLVAVDVEGQTRHILRDDAESLLAAEPSSAVRFLPGHDQWVMGPGTKETHIVPPDRRTLVTRKANLVIAGGVVRGTWMIKDDELAVRWLDNDTPPHQDLAEETGRLASIFGRPLGLVLQTS